MHIDPAVIANLMTGLVLIVGLGGYLCRVYHQIGSLQESLTETKRDLKEHVDWVSRMQSVLESRVRYLERERYRDQGRRGLDADDE